MRWEGREGSSNIEDRRGMRIPGGRGGGFGCIGLLVVLGISLLTGADPRALLGILGLVEQVTQQQAPPAQEAPAGQAREGDPQAQFIGVVLKDTENTWNAIFQKSGKRYQEPTLVLFEGRVSSACGLASAAVGPFYCPLDSKIYLDLAFFRELDRRFGAPGDFAQAYVVAHEVGHHVQNLLGLSDQVQAAQQRARSKEEANAYSVRLELQADCLAGVYGHFNQQYLDPGDVEEGLRAAAAIGDDTLQRKSQGRVVPESFTHGSSEQRVAAFRQGMNGSSLATCGIQ
jgi:predicted metalloprotease